MAAVLSAPLEAQQSKSPTFRAGVGLVRVQVTVLDDRTRLPVRDLGVDDFEITVDSAPQTVATVAEVVHAPSEVVGMLRSGDVTRTQTNIARLVVIVMNDAAGRNDPFDRRTGVEIAERIIDELTPGDQAAVLFVRDNRNAQDFTSDPELLRASVRQFRPVFTVGTYPMAVLARTQRFLADLHGYRKAIVYISPVENRIRPEGDQQATSIAVDREADLAQNRGLLTLARSSVVSPVPVFAFSTHGLHAPTREDLLSGAGTDPRTTMFEDRMHAIARMTGCRAIVGNNQPSERVPDVMRQFGSFYELGFTPAYPLDGRIRWLRVRVKKPGISVMPESAAISSATSSMSETSVELGADVRGSLAESLLSPVSSGKLDLAMAIAPFSNAPGREHRVVVTIRLPQVPVGQAETFQLQSVVFDGEGRRQLLSQGSDIRVLGDGSTAQDGVEVAFTLNLRPGRYNLRVGVGRATNDDTGNIHTTLVVPDFGRGDLVVSGVIVGSSSSLRVAGRELLADVLPFAPTSNRQFLLEDKVGLLLRVHQGAQVSRSVELKTSILDGAGQRVFEDTRVVSGDEMASPTGFEHRFEPDLQKLGPGEFLVRFVAVSGRERLQREVRLSIRR